MSCCLLNFHLNSDYYQTIYWNVTLPGHGIAQSKPFSILVQKVCKILDSKMCEKMIRTNIKADGNIGQPVSSWPIGLKEVGQNRCLESIFIKVWRIAESAMPIFCEAFTGVKVGCRRKAQLDRAIYMKTPNFKILRNRLLVFCC